MKPLKLLSLFLVVSMLSGCLERNVETRTKAARGRDRLTLKEELEETGAYNKYHDYSLRARKKEQLEIARQENRIANQTKRGLRDGTLMEKYTLPD